MDARSAKADPSNLLRKVVVVRLKGKKYSLNAHILVNEAIKTPFFNHQYKAFMTSFEPF